MRVEERTSELRARIFASIHAGASPTRTQHHQRAGLLIGGAVAITLGIFGYFGALRAAPRPPALIAATALGAAAIAILAAAVGLRRGRSPLDQSRATLATLVVATPVALLAWKIGVSATFEDMMRAWPERPGLRCLGLTLTLALPPLLALVHVRRDSEPAVPELRGAAAGVSVAALTWVLVDLWCPVAHVPHLVLGHLLPTVLLAALGALLGRRVLALR